MLQLFLLVVEPLVLLVEWLILLAVERCWHVTVFLWSLKPSTWLRLRGTWTVSACRGDVHSPLIQVLVGFCPPAFYPAVRGGPWTGCWPLRDHHACTHFMSPLVGGAVDPENLDTIPSDPSWDPEALTPRRYWKQIKSTSLTPYTTGQQLHGSRLRPGFQTIFKMRILGDVPRLSTHTEHLNSKTCLFTEQRNWREIVVQCFSAAGL